MKKITVIIPVYNVERYLSQCLNSVIKQTYTNFEIIAINDGSTDGSLNILNQYKMKYRNIYIINQENQGQSIARNKGIERATGDYIYFLDADDYIATNTFQILIETFEEYNVDLIKFSAEIVIDGIDIQVNKNRYNFDQYFNENKIYRKDEFLDLNIKSFSASPVLYIVKREILQSNKIRYKAGIIHEDDLFTSEVLLNTNKAVYISENFYKRRLRKNSVMTEEDIFHRKKSFNSKCIIAIELRNLLQNYVNYKEREFIQDRINKTIRYLARNYSEIDYFYKIKTIKTLGISAMLKYHYYLLRKLVGNLLKYR